ncbi:MAG TPA: pyridoxal-phosphate dependent enzyme [Puia sp.]|nr:pyridoxal-phosphate dependent enzyme [Puia sp.]
MTDPATYPENIDIDLLRLPVFCDRGIRVQVLRLDKLHPEISGNKWFKLRYFLEAAKAGKRRLLVSFGGAHSNHLVALACAAHIHGYSSLGLVRGEEPANLSPALKTAAKYGMQIQFLSRSEYRRQTNPVFMTELEAAHPDAIIIPPGGAGEPGIRGAGEILSFPGAASYSHIAVAVGTGTTLTGLANAAAPHQHLIGISMLKGTKDLQPLEPGLIGKNKQITMVHDYHFGGYAKKPPSLLSFMNEVFDISGIPTDFVYTGKLFYAIADLAEQSFFPRGSNILMIHSGGLPGNRSLPSGLLHF